MSDLKMILFEETLYYCREWMRLKRELGEWDYLVDIQYSKFHVCYSMIEKSGLEYEYQEWKKVQIQ